MHIVCPWKRTGLWGSMLAIGMAGSVVANAAPKGEDPQLLGLEALARVDRLALDARGAPTFLAGQLGTIDVTRIDIDARRFVLELGDVLRLDGSEDFEVVGVKRDDEGMIQVQLQQTLNGLPVVGAELRLHADETSGAVTVVHGNVASGEGVAYRPGLNRRTAFESSLENDGIVGARQLEPLVLTYVLGQEGLAQLVWTTRVAYDNAQGPQVDRIFADAMEGHMVARHPEIIYGLYRKIYNANNGTTLPGTLMFQEGGSSSDTAAMAAYDNSGITYGFYSNQFGRDSYDGVGAQLISSVHVGSNYNNAYWDGTQMAYGDGDGTTFSNFSNSLDVVAHELTHAVTENTANLTYSNESGALNEAMSDIMGASVEAWSYGGVGSTTWLIGEDCYTPGTAGDALRYMNDPSVDGSSRDYYPDRYTGAQDNGGVHWNSGIANLAYVLLVDGGTHPRGKSTVVVPALGITKGQAIFYRALANYMTSSTNFEGARNATAQAAADLYGTVEVDAVHKAWDAVGVPGGPVVTTELVNGSPISALAGNTGDQAYYVMNIPTGATNLVISTAGGSGDVDLYVKYGAAPTTSSYDCRPYKWGNSESCTFSAPSAGQYHIMLRAYSSYSGVALSGSYTGGAANQAPTAAFSASTSNLTVVFSDSSTDIDGSVVAWSWTFGDGAGSSLASPSHTYASAGTYTVALTVTDDAGATGSTSQSVTVTAPPANQAPTAGFTASTADLTASFTDGSSDPDGSVVAWSWTFGDGAGSSLASPSHTYASAGTYTVALTVTDDAGATGSTSQSVTVTAPPANQAPTAGFTSSTLDLTASFTDSSSDPDGSVVGWSWTFGDGAGSSLASPSHTYASAGTYTVALTVTDDAGATGSTSQSVTVTAPANVAPVADFAWTADGLFVAFSDLSTDVDGSVVVWSWSFGDGGASSIANPSHTYAADGAYTVTLTVTDNSGGSGSLSQSLTVSAPVGNGAPCTACDAYTGTLTGSGDAQAQPNGTYYYSASGVHEGWLEGPTNADFDLYLYKWSGWGWSRVGSSETNSSSEHISYNGGSGYYYWRIYSYSGSGSYDFWLVRP